MKVEIPKRDNSVKEKSERGQFRVDTAQDGILLEHVVIVV